MTSIPRMEDTDISSEIPKVTDTSERDTRGIEDSFEPISTRTRQVHQDWECGQLDLRDSWNSLRTESDHWPISSSTSYPFFLFFFLFSLFLNRFYVSIMHLSLQTSPLKISNRNRILRQAILTLSRGKSNPNFRKILEERSWNGRYSLCRR